VTQRSMCIRCHAVMIVPPDLPFDLWHCARPISKRHGKQKTTKAGPPISATIMYFNTIQAMPRFRY